MSAPATPITGWKSLADSKRASTSAKIPQSWLLPPSLTAQFHEKATLNVLDVPRTSGLLTEKELAITEDYDAVELINLMSKKELKSIDVVTAFCKRAAIAQQCVNCLTEIMFDEALVRARECDEYLEREGKTMGAFHGLPISLKDLFNVKGVQATIGFTSFIAHPPAEANSVLVDILHAEGAVFYCKTNLPQTMMTPDSHNYIFGRTLNPHNLSLTAGGSSGGEAALVAMKGSVLGVGSDVAGSIRIPPLCCGLSSIKPTASRIPFAGSVIPTRFGSPCPILPVNGPCGRSLRDYELFLKTVVAAQPWNLDEDVMNVPWRTVQPSTQPLRFGLVRGCKERPLHPPIARALHTAATLLKKHGHTVVLLDDKIPDLYQSALLSWRFFMLDSQMVPFKHVQASGEPMIPSIPTAMFKELEGWEPSLDKLFDANVERSDVCRKWREIFAGEKLDALISCGYQATAVPHDTFGVPVYTVLQNLLNYPAGILPFGKANKDLDAPFFKSDVGYEPPYDPDTFEGAPAHVQITGKPMMDEELVEIMKVVEGILKENA